MNRGVFVANEVLNSVIIFRCYVYETQNDLRLPLYFFFHFSQNLLLCASNFLSYVYTIRCWFCTHHITYTGHRFSFGTSILLYFFFFVLLFFCCAYIYFGACYLCMVVIFTCVYARAFIWYLNFILFFSFLVVVYFSVLVFVYFRLVSFLPHRITFTHHTSKHIRQVHLYFSLGIR